MTDTLMTEDEIEAIDRWADDFPSDATECLHLADLKRLCNAARSAVELKAKLDEIERQAEDATEYVLAQINADQAAEIKRLRTLSDDMLYILGRPNFACHPLAVALRTDGQEIPRIC